MEVTQIADISTPNGISAIEFVKDQKIFERVMKVLAQIEHGFPKKRSLKTKLWLSFSVQLLHAP